ncbi:MAG: D-2-hydroxyacid dehydrogenase [Phycisphaeraceae bacterium]|nr:D-2-hydroxyacid dehydrogenase [Phycisphaeraceae bacterium]
MNIVVLDGHTLNPGDLSWAPLETLGQCTVYERTSPDDMISRAQDAHILVTNKACLNREIIQALPVLQYIGVTATGYNIVDASAARDNHVIVTNVPAYSTDSVAQMVFSHLLNLTHHVTEHAQSVQRGEWQSSPDFAYWHFPLIELAGQTMGIIGFGRIGRATAKLALAFGMKVLMVNPSPKTDIPQGVTPVTLDRLFCESDVISLHCPLTPDTAGIINTTTLSQMKPSAFLINTGRGPLVKEQDLAEALNAGTLAGAGLDVLSCEPPEPDNPLIQAKNCTITPHIAWASKAARIRLLQCTIENVEAFVKGKPQNVVNA